jgi:hypothetical protein
MRTLLCIRPLTEDKECQIQARSGLSAALALRCYQIMLTCAPGKHAPAIACQRCRDTQTAGPALLLADSVCSHQPPMVFTQRGSKQ